jgi:hypothetical protein
MSTTYQVVTEGGGSTDDVIVNLTGHDVLLTDGYIDRLLPAARPDARVDSKERCRDLLELGGLRIPVIERFDPVIIGLPDREPGAWYLASSLVAAYAQRDDVLAPAGFVRDRDGRVQAARKLARVNLSA